MSVESDRLHRGEKRNRKTSGTRRETRGRTSCSRRRRLGLLSEEKSRSVKYRGLSRLALRGISLMLKARRDAPIRRVLVRSENVSRIATRGRFLLERYIRIATHARIYAVAETMHELWRTGRTRAQRLAGHVYGKRGVASRIDTPRIRGPKRCVAANRSGSENAVALCSVNLR
jgi:hypothetical protein